MNDLPNQLFSEELLNSFISKVFAKSSKNIHVTLACFRGAGRPSQLRYILANYKKLGLPENRVYVWLDLALLGEDMSLGYKSSVTSLLTYFSNNFLESETALLHELSEKETVNALEYSQFVQALLLKNDRSITFIVENAGKLYDNSTQSKALVNLLLSINKLSYERTSLIFVADREFTALDAKPLGALWACLTANIVWGDELVFDDDSVEISINLHEKLYSIKFPPAFRNKIKNHVYGDPSLLKRILMVCVGEPSLIAKFAESVSVQDFYNLVGATWLDDRYQNMVLNCTPDSIKALVEGSYDRCSEFIKRTGILSKAGEVSPLLEIYLEKYGKNLYKKMRTSSLRIDPATYLSGQEYLVLEILNDNIGRTVSKDTLARLLWGDAWEENYSDWALDKLMSTLRKKLVKNGYDKTIKTLRGKGFLLT